MNSRPSWNMRSRPVAIASSSANHRSIRSSGEDFCFRRCTLIAVAMVHSDSRTACAIALALFATGIALSVLMIAAYNRPFEGDISVGPELLKQVIPSELAPAVGR